MEGLWSWTGMCLLASGAQSLFILPELGDGSQGRMSESSLGVNRETHVQYYILLPY